MNPREWLDLTLFNNTLAAWLTALGLALAINLVVAVLKSVIITRLSKISARTATALDDSLVEAVRRTRQWLVFFVTLYIGSRYLELPDRADIVSEGAATLALFVQFGIWLGTLLDFWLKRYRARVSTTDPGAATTVAAMGFVGRILVWAFVVLLALDNLGIDVTALVAGLGIGGIAVALAVQNILGDLFASLSIFVDKPFVIGDFIIVDDYLGTVEHIGLKTTRIRSLGGEQIVFSNSDLLKARLRNYKRMYERRVVFKFGVLYQTTPERAEKIPQIVRGIIEQQALARLDRVHFKAFGDSSLDFEVVYWMKDPDYNKYMDTQQAVNLAMMRAFAAENIVFAYPTRSLYLEAPVQVEMKAA